MRLRTALLWLSPIALCGGCGVALYVHANYVRHRVGVEVEQAYQAVSKGDYAAIRAPWICRPRSLEALRKLDARYGRPLAWHARRVLVDVGGTPFEGRVWVRRKRMESIETFNLAGIQGVHPDLGRVPTWDLKQAELHPIDAEKEALATARPILHQLDWDIEIHRVTAERAGDEWRITCEGLKGGLHQTRFLILSKDGEPLEHVRSRLADYPDEAIERIND